MKSIERYRRLKLQTDKRFKFEIEHRDIIVTF
jgi:hypothetical protein